MEDIIFYRAIRNEKGIRSYQLEEGEPLKTSYGMDLYLDSKNIPYEVITVADAKEDRDIVLEVSGQRSVPVTVINDYVILGFEKAEIDAALAEMNN